MHSIHHLEATPQSQFQEQATAALKAPVWPEKGVQANLHNPLETCIGYKENVKENLASYESQCSINIFWITSRNHKKICTQVLSPNSGKLRESGDVYPIEQRTKWENEKEKEKLNRPNRKG